MRFTSPSKCALAVALVGKLDTQGVEGASYLHPSWFFFLSGHENKIYCAIFCARASRDEKFNSSDFRHSSRRFNHIFGEGFRLYRVPGSRDQQVSRSRFLWGSPTDDVNGS